MKLTGRVKGKNILYRSDCKEALQKLIEKGILVDLIYLDPPFNSNRVYNIIYKGKGGKAQQKAFDDTWVYTTETQQMLEEFNNYLEGEEKISDVVKQFLKIWINSLADMSSKDKSMISYLIYMAERLVLMKKILKDTGSIYYHCDPTASHYIKIIMDGIFGSDNFQNEIIWGYRTGGVAKKHWAKKHDVILFYSKTKNFYFNYQNYLSLQKHKYGFGKKHGYELIEKNGVFYKEAICRDIWDDIDAIGTQGRPEEPRLGYNTQKPLALLDRIIKASCPIGTKNVREMVLDPFCGCGTTVAKAKELGLKWIGIDISLNAINIIKERIGNNVKYLEVDGDPESRTEYDKLDPFKKQEFLVNKVGGACNKKKTGDEGVDGEITVHLGEENSKDKWGKMIISVKTGKQCNPEMVRELIGTVEIKGAVFGGLIIEADPSDKMEELAEKQGKIRYSFNKKMPPQEYNKIQILTASDIIDKKYFNIPNNMQEVRLFRKQKQLGE